MDLTEERGDPRRWLVLVLFCCFTSSNSIQWITYGSIYSPSREFFNLTTNQLNMFSTIYMIVFAAGALLTCTTFERWGVRPGVLIGGTLNALGSILKFAPGLQVRTYPVQMFAQVVNSLAQLFILSTPPLIAAHYFPPRRRAFATSAMATANSLGIAVAMLIPPLIVKGPNANQFYILFGIEMGYCCVVLALMAIFIRPPKFRAPTRELLAETAGGSSLELEDGEPLQDQADDREHSVSNSGNFSVNKPHKGGVATGALTEPTATSYEVGDGADEDMTEKSCCKRFRSHPQIVPFIEVGHTVFLLMKRIDFVLLLAAISIGLGSVWCCSSVLAQILEPFGLSAELAGIAGALNYIVGTILSYFVGLWVDKKRHYRWPLTICLGGAVICCVCLIVIMKVVTPNTPKMTGLCMFFFVFAGVFQNTAGPIAFEFAMELTYPLMESVPGVLLMMGANVVSLVMLSISSSMIGDDEIKKSSCIYVITMVTCVCVVGTVCAALTRERLLRYDAEKRARAALDEEEQANAYLADHPSAVNASHDGGERSAQSDSDERNPKASASVQADVERSDSIDEGAFSPQ